MTITMHQVAPVGFEVTVNGQRYRSVGGRPYRTRAGGIVELNMWASSCADCGAAFEAGSVPGAPLSLSRRCDLHKQPGKRVR